MTSWPSFKEKPSRCVSNHESVSHKITRRRIIPIAMINNRDSRNDSDGSEKNKKE